MDQIGCTSSPEFIMTGGRFREYDGDHAEPCSSSKSPSKQLRSLSLIQSLPSSPPHRLSPLRLTLGLPSTR